MKSILLTTLALISLAFTSSAFGNQNNLISGTWSSECASDNSGHSMTETFYFSGSTATYSIKTYSDMECSAPLSTLTTYRKYKLGNAVPGMANTRKLDYVFNSVTMTYHSQEAVAAANKAPGYYGYTNWKLDQSKDVTGLKKMSGSSSEHAKGEQFYTIVRIDNNKLYMGDYDSGAGTSDKTRLKAIYEVPFIKQP